MESHAQDRAGRRVVLTGDRPTGPLHLGHYVGSLRNRITLQNTHDQYIMIADLQALTDHYESSRKVHDSVFEVMLDYLSVGIDPKKSTIFIQSCIPEIAELTLFYMNLVTVNRLRRNPTVKNEIQQKGYGDNVTAGFLMYPVSQAADITIVKATLVPVGEDQLPMIEQTNELVRAFNRIYHAEIFPEVEAMVPKFARLPGVDGAAKMGKSLGNAIFLSDSSDVIVEKVRAMYTDPNHLRVSDPGKVEGNVVFTYLDIFDPNPQEVVALKEQYQQGGLGDMVLKKRLTDILNAFLDPIRARRKEFSQHRDEIECILVHGNSKVREIAYKTMAEVRVAMGLTYE